MKWNRIHNQFCATHKHLICFAKIKSVFFSPPRILNAMQIVKKCVCVCTPSHDKKRYFQLPFAVL